MIHSRYPVMMGLLQSKYDVAFVGASGTWYSIVLDAFMVRRLDEIQPQAIDVPVTRIEGGEFDDWR